ncbi:MAG: RNA polymerase sigma factor [Pyrinomonadaceae bacterium]
MSIVERALQSETLIRPAEDDGLDAFRAERTDAQLVEIVLCGDQSAFEELFDRHKRLAASVASRYVRRPEQVEEVIQTAFAKVFVELDRFRGENDLSFASWLARITSNTCLDLLRQQKRRPEDLVEDLAGVELRQTGIAHHRNTEDKVINRDLAAKLLSHVPADDRALLHMLYAEEMSMAEAAEQLGWSVSKTKVRAWRARHSLRRTLRRYL